jgi:peptidoglycan/LPS O-acetylase OafA/YrhL
MLAGGIFGILALLCLIGMIVCQIIIVIRMFKDAGAVHGIIGLLCGLWAFIWGWMNAGRLGVKNIMLAWTALIILYMVFFGIGGGMAAMTGGGMPTAP